MISTRQQGDMASALSQLDAALSLSPRYEPALELKARCLLSLRRYKDIADMLQDYIPSYKMANSDDSSGSSSDNSSQPLFRDRVKLLRSSSSGGSGNSEWDSPSCDYPSFKCFSVSDLKKKVLAGLGKNGDKEGQWRYKFRFPVPFLGSKFKTFLNLLKLTITDMFAFIEGKHDLVHDAILCPPPPVSFLCSSISSNL